MRRVGGVAAWWAVLAFVLWACAALARVEYVGIHPIRAALLHTAMLAAAWPLIQWFPYRRRARWVVLGAAVAARILMLPLDTSDDVHRYVWEGRVLSAGHDPYLLPPDHETLVPLRDAHWDRLNNRHMTAIYPPGMLLVFRGMAAFTDSPDAFKRLFAAADVACVALLLSILGRLGRKPAWALLYALNPVVLLAFAGEGHLDVLMILALLASVRLHQAGRHVLSFACLAGAIQAKYVAVLLLPFLMNRENLRRAWTFPLFLLLPLVAFWPLAGLATSLTAFSTEMHYNSSIHRLLGVVLNDFSLASLICAGLLAAWMVAARLITSSPMEGGALGMAGLLLLSPNVHFWYLAWCIPFLCVWPLRPLLLLCGTIAISYVTQGYLHSAGKWKEFPFLILLEYAPVYALLAAGWLLPSRPRRVGDARPSREVRTVSVIVPALNEALVLPAFLHSVREWDDTVTEVVLCDGGSTDGTAEQAAAAGLTVVHSPPGRGRQCRAGIARATGDAVFLAHMDMTLGPEVPRRIVEALNRSDAAGGAVGCRFDRAPLFLRLITWLNSARARWFGVSFGDQGQFFRREALHVLGGFPDLQIMEDVELSLRMKREGLPLYLGGGIVVSARRWERVGHLRNAFNILRLLAVYSVRRLRSGRVEDVSDIYRAYYGAGGSGPAVGKGTMDSSELDAGTTARLE
jgi:rSAM/selenodomain-associated transferase 2